MSKDGKNEKVGYKTPPKKTQFKKGKSGNPKGRPKKPDHLYFADLCIAMLNENIMITENGTKKEMLKKEAFVRSVYNQSLSGKATYAKLFQEILFQHVLPHEEREIKKQIKQEEIDSHQPATAIEAAEKYRELIRSLKHDD